MIITQKNLLIIPANTEFYVLKKPINRIFHSDVLLIPSSFFELCRKHHIFNKITQGSPVLSIPLSNNLHFSWSTMLSAVSAQVTNSIKEYQIMGFLKTLFSESSYFTMSINHNKELSENVRVIISMSPKKHWTVQSVAEHLGIGSSNLRRKLKDENNSFRRILVGVRMSYSMDILKATNKSISTVAAEVGYRSSYRFISMFRKYYGVEPKMIRNGDNAL
ncbi:helix-turn-helix transcriptional regulator [Salmonella enterica]|nr:helix-turn-helix transcriptional regulator [Salmonella enterica]